MKLLVFALVAAVALVAVEAAPRGASCEDSSHWRAPAPENFDRPRREAAALGSKTRAAPGPERRAQVQEKGQERLRLGRQEPKQAL